MQSLIGLENRQIVEAEMSSLQSVFATLAVVEPRSLCPITAHLFKSYMYRTLSHLPT